MVGKWSSLVVLLALATASNASLAPDHSAHGQLNLAKRHNHGSSIKPKSVTKLQHPNDKGVGTCQSSISGTLKDVGHVDSVCKVKWSDQKKELRGKYHSDNPYSTIKGDWVACPWKTKHTESIKVHDKSLDTMAMIDHCGAITVTIDIPLDLDCTMEGTKYVCKGQIPDVPCDNMGGGAPPPSPETPTGDHEDAKEPPVTAPPSEPPTEPTPSTPPPTMPGGEGGDTPEKPTDKSTDSVELGPPLYRQPPGTDKEPTPPGDVPPPTTPEKQPTPEGTTPPAPPAEEEDCDEDGDKGGDKDDKTPDKAPDVMPPPSKTPDATTPDKMPETKAPDAGMPPTKAPETGAPEAPVVKTPDSTDGGMGDKTPPTDTKDKNQKPDMPSPPDKMPTPETKGDVVQPPVDKVPTTTPSTTPEAKTPDMTKPDAQPPSNPPENKTDGEKTTEELEQGSIGGEGSAQQVNTDQGDDGTQSSKESPKMSPNDMTPGDKKPEKVPSPDMTPGDKKPEEVPSPDTMPGEKKPGEKVPSPDTTTPPTQPDKETKPGDKVPSSTPEKKKDLPETSVYRRTTAVDSEKPSIFTSLNKRFLKKRL